MESKKPDPMTVILTRELQLANQELARLRAEVRKLKGEDRKPTSVKF